MDKTLRPFSLFPFAQLRKLGIFKRNLLKHHWKTNNEWTKAKTVKAKITFEVLTWRPTKAHPLTKCASLFSNTPYLTGRAFSLWSLYLFPLLLCHRRVLLPPERKRVQDEWFGAAAGKCSPSPQRLPDAKGERAGSLPYSLMGGYLSLGARWT